MHRTRRRSPRLREPIETTYRMKVDPDGTERLLGNDRHEVHRDPHESSVLVDRAEDGEYFVLERSDILASQCDTDTELHGTDPDVVLNDLIRVGR